MRLMPLALAAATSLGAHAQGSAAETIKTGTQQPVGAPLSIAHDKDAASITGKRSAVPPTP